VPLSTNRSAGKQRILPRKGPHRESRSQGEGRRPRGKRSSSAEKGKLLKKIDEKTGGSRQSKGGAQETPNQYRTSKKKRTEQMGVVGNKTKPSNTLELQLRTSKGTARKWGDILPRRQRFPAKRGQTMGEGARYTFDQ